MLKTIVSLKKLQKKLCISAQCWMLMLVIEFNRCMKGLHIFNWTPSQQCQCTHRILIFPCSSNYQRLFERIVCNSQPQIALKRYESFIKRGKKIEKSSVGSTQLQSADMMFYLQRLRHSFIRFISIILGNKMFLVHFFSQ